MAAIDSETNPSPKRQRRAKGRPNPDPQYYLRQHLRCEQDQRAAAGRLPAR
jgi:hypothetical protein